MATELNLAELSNVDCYAFLVAIGFAHDEALRFVAARAAQ